MFRVIFEESIHPAISMGEVETRRFEATFHDTSTWVHIMELGVIPGFRAMGYILPETDEILYAMKFKDDGCCKEEQTRHDTCPSEVESE